MASVSEVKSGLQAISDLIAGSTQARDRAKTQLLSARNQLAAVPTQFSDVIATVNGYTPTGAFESLSKDEKDKLQTEFTALKSALEAELDALGVSYS